MCINNKYLEQENHVSKIAYKVPPDKWNVFFCFICNIKNIVLTDKNLNPYL